MLDVLGKDCFEVTAAEDKHPVEALAPDGADHALTDGVGLGCSDGGGDDSGAVGGEDGVEGGASRSQHPQPFSCAPQDPEGVVVCSSL